MLHKREGLNNVRFVVPFLSCGGEHTFDGKPSFISVDGEGAIGYAFVFPACKMNSIVYLLAPYVDADSSVSRRRFIRRSPRQSVMIPCKHTETLSPELPYSMRPPGNKDRHGQYHLIHSLLTLCTHSNIVKSIF
jgi:hypothetical protein